MSMMIGIYCRKFTALDYFVGNMAVIQRVEEHIKDEKVQGRDLEIAPYPV